MKWMNSDDSLSSFIKTQKRKNAPYLRQDDPSCLFFCTKFSCIFTQPDQIPIKKSYSQKVHHFSPDLVFFFIVISIPFASLRHKTLWKYFSFSIFHPILHLHTCVVTGKQHSKAWEEENISCGFEQKQNGPLRWRPLRCWRQRLSCRTRTWRLMRRSVNTATNHSTSGPAWSQTRRLFRGTSFYSRQMGLPSWDFIRIAKIHPFFRNPTKFPSKNAIRKTVHHFFPILCFFS